MKSKYYRIITYSAMGSIMLLFFLATVAECFFGKAFAIRWFYTAPWTIALWVIACIVGITYIIHERKTRQINIWAFLLHCSFPVILSGSAITHVFSRDGSLTLETNEPVMLFQNTAGEEEMLPYYLMLESESNIVVLKHISSSDSGSDSSEKSFVSAFIDGFKSVASSKEIGSKSTIALPAFSPAQMKHLAELEVVETLPVRVGKTVLYQGWRLYPADYNAESQALLLEVNYDPIGRVVTYAGYTFLAVMMCLYLIFGQRRHSRETHQRHHRHTHDYIGRERTHSSRYKAVSLLLCLMPVAAQAAPADTIYHAVDSWFCLPLAVVLILAGAVLFAIYCVQRCRQHHLSHWAGYAIAGSLLLVWLVLTMVLCWQWNKVGHAPLYDMHEKLQTLAWFVMLLSLCWSLRSRAVLSYGYIVSGVSLLTAALITPTAADSLFVGSALVGCHAMLTILACAFFALVACNGVAALLMDNTEQHRMRHLSEKMLRHAVCFYTLSICIGVVCTDFYLGHYWDWSPREVWSLITLCAYGAPLHRRSLIQFDNVRFYHIYTIIAFFFLLITYLTINV